MTTNTSVAATSTLRAVNEELKMEYLARFGSVGDKPMEPKSFTWSDDLKANKSLPELQVPQIDMKKFMSGNESDVEEITRLVDEACKKHGFFLVMNHGVEMGLVEDVHKCMEEFFQMPIDFKMKAKRVMGKYYGYYNSYFSRFSTNLTWKETFSVLCPADKNAQFAHDYVCKTLGQDFAHQGKAYEKCGKEMSKLCMNILELLGLSIGVGREEFKKFYEHDNESALLLNYYPTCKNPEETLGTGPHCDQTSITILHQNNVSGLQVYVDDQWHSISPTKDSFVVNIGDIFKTQTNGIYKSGLHRAVVNSDEVRRTFIFFMFPKASKVVRAPEELVEKYPPRKFPDYTFSLLDEFIQTVYRADSNTMEAFEAWLQNKNKSIGIDSASAIAPPSL